MGRKGTSGRLASYCGIGVGRDNMKLYMLVAEHGNCLL